MQEPDEAPQPEPVRVKAAPQRPLGPSCPYCAIILDPPPVRDRRCPSCRHPIVVRRVDGRTVYLVDASVPIFERERDRAADELRWTAERKAWLKLAASVRATADDRSALAAAELSAATVEACRTLYLETAERAARAARREKRWADVARIRRALAATLFGEAGGPVPPPDEIAAMHREGMVAELRAIEVSSKTAELVGAMCCPACREGDGKVFRITTESKAPRLPHPGCPKGICGCEWLLALTDPTATRRRRRRRATSPTAGSELD